MAKMTKAVMTRRLNEIGLLINALDTDVKEQYGEKAFIFAEADGGIHVMKDDADPDKGSLIDRQKFIVASTSGYVCLGVGAW